jgi:pimeloyl-ACP methyl ester carboxylesterase
MSRSHLILVPGLLCDAAVWEEQARDLQDLVDIIIPDHGSLDSFDAMARSILSRSPQRFALAGHSMGGRVAFELLRLAPERITGVALLDTSYTPLPAGSAGEEEAAKRYRLLAKARKEGMRAMGWEWLQGMVHPDRFTDERLTNAILDMIDRKTPAIHAAQIKALLQRPDAAPILQQIRCPALVLCGRQDFWSVPAVHEEMAARIRHSRLVVIENCGHMSTMERPSEVTAALRAWITSL